jgi:uncharacterized membrane protein YphA (DoxX/SURF4 family)
VRTASILLVTIVVAVALWWQGAFSWFGNLPGDVYAEGEAETVDIPFTSLLVTAVVLAAVVQVFVRLLLKKRP